MPQIQKPELPFFNEPPPQAGSPKGGIDLAITFVRRRYPVLLFALVVASVVGALYLLTTPATYTAVATMLIDSRKGELFQNQSVLGETPSDAAWIDSQVGVLALERGQIGLAVAKQLDLEHDKTLLAKQPEFFKDLIAGILSVTQAQNEEQRQKTQAERLEMAASVVAGNLEVKRIGLSYLVAISYSSHNPEEAVRIANAAAEAYVVEEMNTKFKQVRRASDWLQQRYLALGDKTAAADLAVAEFERAHHIITNDGKAINDEQTAELNKRLAVARARTAEAYSKLSEIQAILKSDLTNSTVDKTVSDSLKDQIITNLRAEYLELANREAEWAARFGRKHLAVVGLRTQERAIQNAILQELRRIAATYASDYEIAKRNQESLEAEVAKVSSQIPNDTQIKLHALKSSADSYRTFYNNFLLHYTESVQQESSPLSATRVVAHATAAYKTHPLVMKIAGMSMFTGIAVGIGLGMLQDALDHAFRTGEQVRTALNMECLAMVPFARRRSRRVALAPPQTNNSAGQGRKMIAATSEVRRMIAVEPRSLFGDAIGAVRLAADLRRDKDSSIVIGFTSSVPREGKSTVAMAFAHLDAQLGTHGILVDLDFRNPWLTQTFAPKAERGILAVLAGQTSLQDVVWKDLSTGMAFLPAVVRPSLPSTYQILAGDNMKRLFARLRNHYDYIIVDLPPLSPIADVRATTELVDAYVVVVEWGQTSIKVVQQCLREAPKIYDKAMGVVLNKVHVNALGRYDCNQVKYYRALRI